MKNKTKYQKRRQRELVNRAERVKHLASFERLRRLQIEEQHRRLRSIQDADPQRQLHQRLVNILAARLWQDPGYRAVQTVRIVAGSKFFRRYWP